MSVPSPQRAAGVSTPETRGVPRGEIVLQPVVFERLDGEQLHFSSISSFISWWDDGQRRKTLAEEFARPA